jgi:tellurite resistance protein TerC
MDRLRRLLRDWFGEYTRLRKAVVGLLGVSIVIVGAAMLLLPGPAIIVIPAGLALLATEFAWARRLLRRVKKQFTGVSPDSAGKKSKAARKDPIKNQHEREDHV